MRTYTIHSRPDADEVDIQVIREGFSWGAFVFTALWALWHRLWLAFIALVVVLLVLDVAIQLFGFAEPVSLIIGLAASVLIGYAANDWRRRALERRGYVMSAVIAAQDGDAALRRYMDLAPAATA